LRGGPGTIARLIVLRAIPALRLGSPVIDRAVAAPVGLPTLCVHGFDPGTFSDRQQPRRHPNPGSPNLGDVEVEYATLEYREDCPGKLSWVARGVRMRGVSNRMR